MIVGIGVDIVNVGRVARLINTNPRFTEKVFTPNEASYANSKASPAQSYAARFAAKEAFMKALGTGWDKGVSWRDMEILNTDSGKPELYLSGITKQLAEQMGVLNIHISLSHEKEYAIAQVVLEG
ncbi:MAG: holo-ACP synthase [Candidatus Cloacimonetes bacterium]|jgi:holo-[acyl-carrier protein] synthase|nr:holo-ACP synthase [Candidatus Cloacimonadota bacterium]MDD2210904.1 holo-ACP synthase [Candidatus Cloacimonadota bacterium]MDD4232446.1 holo-ACP synthase [Candidatus Cloacimonadota bacterium]MDD4687416.1 holo-ACP synthase [Candidatus Cloacimonadota bacterium]MDY0299148.1 holo-ACP synthase [Candidatus Cloacimonadaceae bacterium]